MSATADAAPDALPHWDLAPLFPALDSPAYRSARQGWTAQLDRLQTLLDEHGIRAGAPSPGAEADAAALDAVIEVLSEIEDSSRPLFTYVNALVTTDAADTEAPAEQARLRARIAPLATLETRLNGWIAERGADVLAAGSPLAGEHRSWLTRCAQSAEHQLTEAEEDLLAAVEVPGVRAAMALVGEITSTLTGTLRGETRPVTVLRTLAGDEDPELRRDAYHAEVAAWQTVARPIAACLNTVAGHADVVDRRRGWPDIHARNRFTNRVTPAILDAMQTAMTESFPDFRRYLRAKATLHGHAGPLPWWDLVAPVPGAPAYDWARAEAAVQDAFGTFSPRLRALAERAFRERWVDAGPRAGKRGGGFCMCIGEDRSRILMNFDGSFDGVQTLAHELGHAYHNTNLAACRPLLRATPMALAETASTFCETLMVQAGLREADDAGRLALLANDLSGACAVVVDIHSRFRFESELRTRRADGPLSVEELCEAMRRAQTETYGDGVDPDTYHVYAWAGKPHYYMLDQPFYNWPYAFGLLFGIGLYARYTEDPDGFRSDYDEMLSRTGTLDAAPLAARFGIDVTDIGFWRSSLDVLRSRIDEFTALAATAAPTA